MYHLISKWFICFTGLSFNLPSVLLLLKKINLVSSRMKILLIPDTAPTIIIITSRASIQNITDINNNSLFWICRWTGQHSFFQALPSTKTKVSYLFAKKKWVFSKYRSEPINNKELIWYCSLKKIFRRGW